jgi:hypothetical protein
LKTLAILALPAAFLSASLASCSTAGETYTAQGNMVYEVTCRFQSVNACLAEAGKTCGTLGYRQVQKDGSPLPPPPAIAPAPTLNDKIGYDRKIYVKCGHEYKPED